MLSDDGRHAEFQRLEVGRVRLHFGHEHVHTLGQFQREFVGSPVAGPDERQPIPVEPVGRGAVLDVRSPPVADDYAILVVANPVVVAEIEFVDLDLVAVADRAGVEGVRVPLGHHLHAFDHVLMPSLGVRPDGPWTRSGFQRPIHGAKAKR